MMMLDSSEIDDDFNEDIFCDSCHSLWPEEIYIEHWEMCTERRAPKKKHKEHLEQELMHNTVKQRERQDAIQKRYKEKGRKKSEFDNIASQRERQMKKRSGTTINTMKKQESYQRGLPASRRNLRISQSSQNKDQAKCTYCGIQMPRLQLETVHPAYCEFSPVRCPYCQEQFTQQLLVYHKQDCTRNNRSPAQQLPQLSQLPIQLSTQPAEQQYNFENHNPTPQALDYYQRIWNDAKMKNKGLKEQQIKLFDILKYEKPQGQEESDMCTICRDQIQEGADYMRLPCKHPFHPHCIKNWVKKIAECPNCKFNIKEKFVLHQ